MDFSDGNGNFIPVIKLKSFCVLSFEAWNPFIIILLLTAFSFIDSLLLSDYFYIYSRLTCTIFLWTDFVIYHTNAFAQFYRINYCASLRKLLSFFFFLQGVCIVFYNLILLFTLSACRFLWGDFCFNLFLLWIMSLSTITLIILTQELNGKCGYSDLGTATVK